VRVINVIAPQYRPERRQRAVFRVVVKSQQQQDIGAHRTDDPGNGDDLRITALQDIAQQQPRPAPRQTCVEHRDPHRVRLRRRRPQCRHDKTGQKQPPQQAGQLYFDIL